jgi:hypothetical protein
MTKTERNKTINKLVYIMAESLGYEVDMTEIDVTFIPESGNSNDCIEYRRSSHSLAALNWSCEKTQTDVIILEKHIDHWMGMGDNELFMCLVNAQK